MEMANMNYLKRRMAECTSQASCTARRLVGQMRANEQQARSRQAANLRQATPAARRAFKYTFAPNEPVGVKSGQDHGQTNGHRQEQPSLREPKRQLLLADGNRGGGVVGAASQSVEEQQVEEFLSEEDSPSTPSSPHSAHSSSTFPSSSHSPASTLSSPAYANSSRHFECRDEEDSEEISTGSSGLSSGSSSSQTTTGLTNLARAQQKSKINVKMVGNLKKMSPATGHFVRSSALGGSRRRSSRTRRRSARARQVRFQPVPQSINISAYNSNDSSATCEPDENDDASWSLQRFSGETGGETLSENFNDTKQQDVANNDSMTQQAKQRHHTSKSRVVHLSAKPFAKRLHHFSHLKFNKIKLKSFNSLAHQLHQKITSTYNTAANGRSGNADLGQVEGRRFHQVRSSPQQVDGPAGQVNGPNNNNNSMSTNTTSTVNNDDDFGWGSDFDEQSVDSSLASSSLANENAGRHGQTGVQVGATSGGYLLEIGKASCDFRAIENVIQDRGISGQFKRLDQGSEASHCSDESSSSGQESNHSESQDSGHSTQHSGYSTRSSCVRTTVRTHCSSRPVSPAESPPLSSPVGGSTSSGSDRSPSAVRPAKRLSGPGKRADKVGARRGESVAVGSGEPVRDHFSPESRETLSSSLSPMSSNSADDRSVGVSSATPTGLSSEAESSPAERRNRFLQNRLIINSKLESMFKSRSVSCAPSAKLQQATIAAAVSGAGQDRRGNNNKVLVQRSHTVSQLDRLESAGESVHQRLEPVDETRLHLLEQQRQMSLKLKQKPRQNRHIINSKLESMFKSRSVSCAPSAESQQAPAGNNLLPSGGPLPRAPVSLRQLVKDVIDDCERPSKLSSLTMSILNRSSDSFSSDLAGEESHGHAPSRSCATPTSSASSEQQLTTSVTAKSSSVASNNRTNKLAGGRPLVSSLSLATLTPTREPVDVDCRQQQVPATTCLPIGYIYPVHPAPLNYRDPQVRQANHLVDQSISSVGSSIDGLEYSQAFSSSDMEADDQFHRLATVGTANRKAKQQHLDAVSASGVSARLPKSTIGSYLKSLRELSRFRLPKIKVNSLAEHGQQWPEGKSETDGGGGQHNQLPGDPEQLAYNYHQDQWQTTRTTAATANLDNGHNYEYQLEAAAIHQQQQQQAEGSSTLAGVWRRRAKRASVIQDEHHQSQQTMQMMMMSSSPVSAKGSNESRFANHFVTISNRKWKSCHLRTSLMQLTAFSGGGGVRTSSDPNSSGCQQQTSSSHGNTPNSKSKHPHLAYLDNSRNFTDDDNY